MKVRVMILSLAAMCASASWAGGVTFVDESSVDAVIAKARAKRKAASVPAAAPSPAPGGLLGAAEVKPAPLTSQVIAAGRYDVLTSDGVIRNALERWAKLSNAQLVYEVDRDHRVESDGDFGTDFEGALQGLMLTTANTDMPLRACLHQQAPRYVVRIIRRTASCE